MNKFWINFKQSMRSLMTEQLHNKKQNKDWTNLLVDSGKEEVVQYQITCVKSIPKTSSYSKLVAPE